MKKLAIFLIALSTQPAFAQPQAYTGGYYAGDGGFGPGLYTPEDLGFSPYPNALLFYHRIKTIIKQCK